MNRIRITVFSSLVFALIIGLSSCERAADEKKITDFSKLQIPMTGAQAGTPSAALGTMDVFYSKETRMLNYTVTWTGLADSVTFMRIHGPAPAGYSTASVVQQIVSTPNPPSTVTAVFPQKNSAGKYSFAKSGTLSASLLVDGVLVKEQDLLNGLYYIVIYTTPYPTGEIRGQIVFQ
jgi:hypothetical protein